MKIICAPLLLISLLLGQTPPGPKIPIGKDTTYVTGPLDKEGYVDFEAAINKRFGAGIAARENANVALWQAMGPMSHDNYPVSANFFKRLGMEEPTARGDYFIPMNAYLKDHLKIAENEWNAFYDHLDAASQRPWSKREHPQIADWLALNEKPLNLAAQGIRRQRYFNPVIALSQQNKTRPSFGFIGLAPGPTGRYRDLTTALVSRALLRVAGGEVDLGWRDLQDSQRLGRFVASGPTLVDGLVGVGIEQISSAAELAFLERAHLSSKQAQKCLKELHELPPLCELADKIDFGERLTFLNALQLLRRGKLRNMHMVFSPAPNETDAKLLETIDYTPAMHAGNLWLDKLAGALRIKHRSQRDKSLAKIDADIDSLVNAGVGVVPLFKIMLGSVLLKKEKSDRLVAEAVGDQFLRLVPTHLHKLLEAFERNEQTQRNLQIAFALAAYHRDQGRYPAKLDAIAPKYLPAVPTDLFSDTALKYVPSNNGYLLYSVGVNGKDDGGQSYYDDPRGDDIRVRMPLKGD